MVILPQEVVEVLSLCVYFVPSELTLTSLQEKRNRMQFKANNIIQSKIIANSNISNINASIRLSSMTRKLHEIGRKFSQT